MVRGVQTGKSYVSSNGRVPDTKLVRGYLEPAGGGGPVRTVDRLIALKELPVRRLGRRVLIPRNGVHNLLRSDHPTKAA